MSDTLKIDPEKLKENISALEKMSGDNEISNLIKSISSITATSTGDNANAVAQINNTFTEIDDQIKLLIDYTLAVLKNTNYTFVEADSNIAKQISNGTGGGMNGR